MDSPKYHAFTDGLSRRVPDDVTLEADPVTLLDEVPLVWTPEHVAGRMVAAFETLVIVGGRVGPQRHANGWPTMLQEFSDLTDADAMANAREAYAKARRRPSADTIGMMDEALGWPMRFALPALQADAVLTWAYCRAGGRSIAAVLRNRVAGTKAILARMQAEEYERIRVARRIAITDAGQWREAVARERGLATLPPAERDERWNKLTTGMRNRIARDLAILVARTYTPNDVAIHRILSRTSLDRYLPRGLVAIADRLDADLVPVR